MPTINIRGVHHYYTWITAHSDNSRSEKPVLVFLHGWAGSTRYWESTAKALCDRFDCLLYDLRGFGRSLLSEDSPEIGYEMEDYAEDLLLLLDELNLDRVWINAHSTGATVAALFAHRYPQKLERVILTCNGIFEYDRLSFEAFHFVGSYVVKFRPRWLDKLPLVDRMFMARFLCRPIPAEQRQAFLTDYLVADHEAALGTIYTAVSEHMALTMPEVFTELSMPILLISGEKDQIIPAPMGKQAAALNPKIEYRMLKNTAHFPMLEDPTAYLSCLEEFVAVGVGSC